MKKEREFLKELNHNGKEIPFSRYFQENKYLRRKLFSQYIKTDLQPSLNLYFNKYFTDKEIQNGLKKASENIAVSLCYIPKTAFEIKMRETQKEFFEKVTEKSIEKKYFCHQIKNTNISTVLTFILQDIEDFKRRVIIESGYDAKQYSDAFTKNLINKLENLQIPELTKLILKDFIKDTENLDLDMVKWNDSTIKNIDERYRELKRYANNNLNDYLKNILLKSESQEPQPIQNKVNVFCKTMPLSIPQEHFKILTTKNSKNGKPFLTQNQYDIFIKRAFLGENHLQKLKFNQAPKGEKLKIQYLFRQFYKNYGFEYFNTGQTQDIFIKLLTENFIGWDFKNVKNNFKTKPKKLI